MEITQLRRIRTTHVCRPKAELMVSLLCKYLCDDSLSCSDDQKSGSCKYEFINELISKQYK